MVVENPLVLVSRGRTSGKLSNITTAPFCSGSYVIKMLLTASPGTADLHSMVTDSPVCPSISGEGEMVGWPPVVIQACYYSTFQG